MTDEQKKHVLGLLHEMSNAAGFALQNAEAGHERAMMKYDDLRSELHRKLVEYISSI